MSTTRRMFIKRAAGTAAVIGCPAILGSCKSTGEISGGNIADYPEGSLVALVGDGVAIGVDSEGVYALSTICTHAQCDIGAEGTVDATEGLVCSCHGSAFDPTGLVVNGPAVLDLEHYKVTIESDGEITIDLATVVSKNTRAAVGEG